MGQPVPRREGRRRGLHARGRGVGRRARRLGRRRDRERPPLRVVERARSLVGARGVLVLLREGDALVTAAATGQVARAEERLDIAATRCGDVLLERKPLRIDDVDADDRLDSAQLGVPDASTALLVPLLYRGRALGVLCAFDRIRGAATYGTEDEELLRAFAASAATAVATARSVEAHRLRAALESSEAERRRWARELHDETLQGLAVLKVLLSAASRSDDVERLRGAVADAVEHVTTEIANLRALITELRPASLDALGLGPALESLAQRVASVEGLHVDAAVELDGAERLPAEMETAIYRVAQEALTNVAKHAKAQRVSVRVDREDGRVRLVVRDDGVGFDPDDPTSGFGLVGMRE
ncbi:MAG: GAF domain-containing sensor histidine kinase, partial [Solirubrobacterales bacterium]|nr:GAF domain-containing sensor histidine kinase [Solirubrobacterales bacterium]